MSGTPAGWYPDPSAPNQLRWWDGAQWTTHVQPTPVAAPPMPAATVANAGAPSVQDQLAAMSLRSEIAALEARVGELRREVTALQSQIVADSDIALLQEIGIYRYGHPLEDSAQHKARLVEIQENIKAIAKSGGAVTAIKRWAVNGSEKEGAKMVAELSKLMLRAYNNEADGLVRSLKPYALEAATERLGKTKDAISKLGQSMKLSITDEYHALRLAELQLTADFCAKLAEEREREREERARLKEEEAVRRESEREQERLGKERTHYVNAIQKLVEKGDMVAAAAATEKLQEVDAALQGVIERAANVRAGYVYVISNLGSFGETVVKIGMTRRLDPMDRVRELGDASVPFRFDVHVMIFSEDAVTLENQLHAAFAKQRINLVNAHREFFYTNPLAVKAELLRLRGDILTFVETPEALEWHQSQNLRGKS